MSQWIANWREGAAICGLAQSEAGARGFWPWPSGPRPALTFSGFRVAGKAPWTCDYQLGQHHNRSPVSRRGTEHETSILADDQSPLHHVLRGSGRQKEVTTPMATILLFDRRSSVETAQLQRDNLLQLI